MLQDLIKIANELDSRGLAREADFLDLTLKNIVASWVGRENQMSRGTGRYSDYGSAMSGSGTTSSSGSRARSQANQAAAPSTEEEAEVLRKLNETIANSFANEYRVNSLNSTVNVDGADYVWSIRKY
jgi:hypothetical protein